MMIFRVPSLGDGFVPTMASLTKPAQPETFVKTQRPPKVSGSTRAMPNGS